MNQLSSLRILRAACATFAATVFLISAASSNAQSPPTEVVDFPAGVACSDFDLRLEIRGGNTVVREFFGKDGNIVRLLNAGVGLQLTFTNLANDQKLSLKAAGSVTKVMFNQDGSSTWTLTGHNVLILYPSDIPAGPSTNLFVGRVVFTVDTNEVFDVNTVSGKSTDICSVLSE
jgi:hypothetical protein